jgi:spermidine synthase
MYLGNVMQSRYYGEAAYHEALVHPSMLAHLHPRRVAIIGGGEGATLREVLKHKTVQQVIMLEIDKDMVDLSREYLNEWSDCSKIAGSEPSCFDDDRAHVLYTDAAAWFLERFGQGKDILEDEKFDIIIMDAL